MPQDEQLPPPLTGTTRVTVRFKESDSLGIVWHGHYVSYLEDARQALGARVGLGYLEMMHEGFAAPIVDLSIKYLQSARYGDKIDVFTSIVYPLVPKIVATFELRRAGTGELLATASTTQVLTSPAGELVLNFPEFMEKIRERWRNGEFADEGSTRASPWG